MKGRLIRPAVLTAVAVGLIAAPTAALADRGLYSYQGGDYSYDYTSKYQVQIHDGENDGNRVKVQYATSPNGSVKELINNAGYNTNAYQSLSGVPEKHRSVEILNARPDAYGPWKYPR